jgi:hypothetical protein
MGYPGVAALTTAPIDKRQNRVIVRIRVNDFFIGNLSFSD